MTCSFKEPKKERQLCLQYSKLTKVVYVFFVLTFLCRFFDSATDTVQKLRSLKVEVLVNKNLPLLWTDYLSFFFFALSAQFMKRFVVKRDHLHRNCPNSSKVCHNKTWSPTLECWSSKHHWLNWRSDAEVPLGLSNELESYPPLE